MNAPSTYESRDSLAASGAKFVQSNHRAPDDVYLPTYGQDTSNGFITVTRQTPKTNAYEALRKMSLKQPALKPGMAAAKLQINGRAKYEALRTGTGLAMKNIAGLKKMGLNEKALAKKPQVSNAPLTKVISVGTVQKASLDSEKAKQNATMTPTRPGETLLGAMKYWSRSMGFAPMPA